MVWRKYRGSISVTKRSASLTAKASPLGSQLTTAGSSFVSMSMSFRGKGLVWPVEVAAGEDEVEETWWLSAGEEERPSEVAGVGLEVGCSFGEERDCVEDVREMSEEAAAAAAVTLRVVTPCWCWCGCWRWWARRREDVDVGGWGNTEAGGGSGPGVGDVALARGAD